MRSARLAAVAFSVGCGVGCGQAPRPGGHPLGFAGDYVVSSPSARREALAPRPRASGAVIYVSFMGDLVQSGSADDATATPPVSQVVSSELQVPPFDSTVPAPHVSTAEAEAAIVDRLRTYYLPWDVTITTTPPASGSYTLILVGGSNTLVGNGAAAGLAPLDCDNLNPSNVVFDFSDVQTPDYGGVVWIATTAAHESGHAFGLQHTDDPTDIMYSAANPMQTLPELFQLSFGQTGSFSGYNAGDPVSSQVQCGRPAAQVNQGVLDGVLGPAASVPAPPSLTWDFPPAGVSDVPLTVPLAFTPSADTARIEIYKNFDLVAVLDGPPWQATVTAADGEAFYLTADAITVSASRASLTRLFTAAARTPALCMDASMCGSGESCADHFCSGPMMPADGGTCSDCVDGGAPDLGGGSSGGCALAGRGPAGGWLLGLLLLALAWRRRIAV